MKKCLAFLVLLTISLNCTFSSSSTLDGHIYESDNLIFRLEFLENNAVKVYTISFGDFIQPYDLKGDIIDIKLWKKSPLKLKILSPQKLKLIAPPTLIGSNPPDAIFSRVK